MDKARTGRLLQHHNSIREARAKPPNSSQECLQVLSLTILPHLTQLVSQKVKELLIANYSQSLHKHPIRLEMIIKEKEISQMITLFRRVINLTSQLAPLKTIKYLLTRDLNLI